MSTPTHTDTREVLPRLVRELPAWGSLLVLFAFGFNIARDVKDIKGDRYSLTMASEDALREAIANPGHRVPDPRRPGQYIVVHLADTTASVP